MTRRVREWLEGMNTVHWIDRRRIALSERIGPARWIDEARPPSRPPGASQRSLSPFSWFLLLTGRLCPPPVQGHEPGAGREWVEITACRRTTSLAVACLFRACLTSLAKCREPVVVGPPNEFHDPAKRPASWLGLTSRPRSGQ